MAGQSSGTNKNTSKDFDQNDVATFLAVTGKEDTKFAEETLQRFNGDIQSAVLFALDGSMANELSGGSSSSNNHGQLSNTLSNNNHALIKHQLDGHRPKYGTPRHKHNSLIFNIFFWPIDTVLSNIVLPIACSVFSLLPTSLFLFLKASIPNNIAKEDIYDKSASEESSKKDAISTITRLRNIYCKSPNYSDGDETIFESDALSMNGYGKFSLDCLRNLSYGLIYLHNDLIGNDAINFVSNEFPSLIREIQSLNKNSPAISIWCINVIQSFKGSELVDMLGCTSFPFFALIVPDGSNLSIGSRIPSPKTHKDVLDSINKCKLKWDLKLRQKKREKEEREYERKIRDEQNYEYERSLELDKQKALEKKKKEEIEHQETLAKKKELQSKKLQIKELRKQFSEEPLSNFVTIRFTLPSGKRAERKFLSSNTLEHAYSYALILMEDFNEHLDNESADILLVSPCPRNIFKDLTKTFEDSGFKRGGVIVIEEDLKD